MRARRPTFKDHRKKIREKDGKAGIMSSCHSASLCLLAHFAPQRRYELLMAPTCHTAVVISREKQQQQPQPELNFECTAKNLSASCHACVRPCLCVFLCACACLCVFVKQIARCILDGCDNLASWAKTSARLLKFQPYPFSCRVFEERRQGDKKLLSLAFTSAMCLGLPSP